MERTRKEPVMRRIVLPRAVLLLAFILLLAVPAVQAAERQPEAKADHSGFALDFLSQAWNFLTSVWESNGCGFDPDGRCLPESSAPEPDNGCGLDPSGGCTS